MKWSSFGDERIVAAAEAYEEYIAGETLALAYESGMEPVPESYAVVREAEIEGVPIRIGMSVLPHAGAGQ